MIELIKLAFWASRPISWLNTAYPFAAAYLLATHQVTRTFILGTLFFLIPYNLLMYGVNDVYDFESDIQNPRKGSIEGARVKKAQLQRLLLISTSVSLPFMIILLATIGTGVSKLVFAAVIFLVLAYSLPGLRFKEIPLLDSITSSCHFVGPMVYGLVLTGWSKHYLGFTIAFFLWGMASHAFGAVQDIVADRKAHIKSIATQLGARRTVWLALVLYTFSGAVLCFYGWAGLTVGLIALIYVLNIWPYRKLQDRHTEQANVAWKRFIWLNWFAGFLITIILIRVYLHQHAICAI